MGLRILITFSGAQKSAVLAPVQCRTECATVGRSALAGADSQHLPKPAFQRNRVAGIPSGVTVSDLGRLRLTLLTRGPRYGGLDTAGAPRRAAAMPAGAIEPDERPTGGVSNIGGWLLKSSCTTDKSNSRGRCIDRSIDKSIFIVNRKIDISFGGVCANEKKPPGAVCGAVSLGLRVGRQCIDALLLNSQRREGAQNSRYLLGINTDPIAWTSCTSWVGRVSRVPPFTDCTV